MLFTLVRCRTSLSFAFLSFCLILCPLFISLVGATENTAFPKENRESGSPLACFSVPRCEYPSEWGFQWRYCSTLGSRLMKWNTLRMPLSRIANGLSRAQKGKDSFPDAPAAAASASSLSHVKDPVRRKMVRQDLLALLNSHLVAQTHITESLLQWLQLKLHRERTPMVLHFVGDNGVGKTTTAELISLAWSLRCDRSEAWEGSAGLRVSPAHRLLSLLVPSFLWEKIKKTHRPSCARGESMLVISGASYMSSAERDIEVAKNRIAQQIHAHQLRFPYGIVLIDDITVMPIELVHALAPLFGRGDRFGFSSRSPQGSSERQGLQYSTAAEHPPLSQLLVLITSDLGREGRSKYKTLHEMEKLVREEMSDLYGSMASSYTHTLVLRRFSTDDAVALVKRAVSQAPCTYGLTYFLAEMKITDEAAAYLVEDTRAEWEDNGENGRALRQAVEFRLLGPLYNYWEDIEEVDWKAKYSVVFVMTSDHRDITFRVNTADGQASRTQDHLDF